MRRATLRFLRGLASLGLGLGALVGCGPAEDESGGVPIGALVPFTGMSAASGANYERAMLLAVDMLNEHAGSTRVRLVVRDTHSSSRGTTKSLRALLEERVVGLIGPDRVELVDDVREELGPRMLSHLLPSSMTLADFADDRSGRLIRPAPAAEYVGCALANRIYGDLNRRLVVIHSPDRYRRAFSNALVSAFESYRFAAHQGTGFAFELPESASNYSDVVAAASALNPEAVVVAADAPLAAKLVRDWTTLGRNSVAWFFEPGLRSEEFLHNVSPASVSGATGISLALPDTSSAFARAFQNQWGGEEPLVESHLYFDAVIALGLAALQAREDGEEPNVANVAERALAVLRGPGQSVSWNDLGRAVELVRAGSPIHYVGAAGRATLNAAGVSDGSAAIFGFWQIRGGSIEAERFGACPAGTIGFE